MKFGKRFGLHFGNGQQYIACLICAIIFNTIDAMFGGFGSLLVYLITVLSQSILSHVLLSLLYAFERAVKKVIYFQKKAGK